MANQFREFSKSINSDKIKSRKVGVIKMTSRVSLQKMINFVVYTSDCITSYSANMVRWAGRASLVIMNQEENDSDTYTSEDLTLLLKPAVINLFETCLSTLLMDPSDDGEDAFVKITALGGTKLYKLTFMVKVVIISVLWEIVLKLLTTLIWQKRHNDQCTVVVGDISFQKTTNVFRGEWRLCRVMSATYSPSPKISVSLVMALIWNKNGEEHDKNIMV